jgi:dTDP-4-amino-4,6-dideoxygalactose transaminase
MMFASFPKAQYQAYRSEIDTAIARVLDSGNYIMGAEVKAFEKEFATHIGLKHAIGVGSGTDALTLALMVLDIGVGDEVISVSHTAVATTAAIRLTGAIPVLVDIEADYFTLDPACLKAAITKKTKAVVVVHLYGQAADMDAICAIAADHGLKVVEDCAQAVGATYKTAELGSIGDIGCFSFFPTKNLGAIGDGGAVLTNNDAFAEILRGLRQYGWQDDRISHVTGMNSRLDELQAAILRVKLRHLDTDTKRRRAIAEQYGELLDELEVDVPKVRPGTNHAFHLYALQCRNRDDMLTHLETKGIRAGVHYPIPVHLQPAYAHQTTLPRTEQAALETLSLPMYPELTAGDIVQIAAAVRSFSQA